MAFIRCFLENDPISPDGIYKVRILVFSGVSTGALVAFGLLLVSDLMGASITVEAETCINNIES